MSNLRSQTIAAADLFCGAGGTSTGLVEACAENGYDVDLLAVNHWDVAIATHSTNHPQARHLCKSLEGVNPRTVVPSGRLDLLVASPECCHHSNARGGKPMSDQQRASAWHVLNWAEALDIENLLIENVKEFRDWGPLHPCTCGTADPQQHAKGSNCLRPVKEEKGKYFQGFLRNLRMLGYTVEYRLLRAADYGDATTRVRLFIQARKGRRRITWPSPTHLPPDRLGLLEDGQPWRTAREIIDWSIPGKSIYFGRKKPLAENTMRRIFAGIRKFSGIPFVMVNRTNNEAHSLEEPLHTLTTGNNMALCEPFLVILRNNQTAQSLDEPIRTLTANVRQFALCEPYLVNLGGPEGQGRAPRSIDEPMRTLLAENHTGICQPFIIAMEHVSDGSGDGRRCYSVDHPMPTVTAKGDFALCKPFVLGQQSCAAPRPVDQPIPTVAGAGAISLIEPFLVPYRTERDGQRPRAHSVSEPLPTQTAENAFALCEPFLVAYHSNGNGHSVDQPIPTIDTRDRYALVESGLIEKGDQVFLLDIRLRMLTPRELANAHSFPADYVFTGNQDDQVKQVGNSVPKQLAKALVTEILRARGRKR